MSRLLTASNHIQRSRSKEGLPVYSVPYAKLLSSRGFVEKTAAVFQTKFPLCQAEIQRCPSLTKSTADSQEQAGADSEKFNYFLHFRQESSLKSLSPCIGIQKNHSESPRTLKSLQLSHGLGWLNVSSISESFQMWFVPKLMEQQIARMYGS